MTSDYFDWTDELFDPGRIFAKPEALDGIRVVEIAHVNLRRGAAPPGECPRGEAAAFAIRRRHRACLPPA